MDSTVGLGIQCVGILLVTLLSSLMMRSIRGISTKYWTMAWTCLLLALFSLFTAFKTSGAVRHIFYSFYFFGEYSFGLMFIAGCHNHAVGYQIKRKHRWAFAPFLALAILLPLASEDFNDLFIVQASIMTILFGTAFYALRPAYRRHRGPGVRVMTLALLLLALDFFQYVPVFGSHQGAWGLPIPAVYFQYTSIFDLILEILLGFGTIMVLMEGMRHEVEATNIELTAARDRLEQLARIDPLTEALNRHAFHSLFAVDQSGATGCVAVIDVDNLKPINDTFGHATGDAAIRAVARGIREVTRAEDMLFRWGGDEFLVIMFGISDQLARQRLNSLDTVIAEVHLPDVSIPLALTVSQGVSSFTGMAGLQHAIDKADAEMYRRKQARKAQIQVGSLQLIHS